MRENLLFMGCQRSNGSLVYKKVYRRENRGREGLFELLQTGDGWSVQNKAGVILEKYWQL